MTNLETLEARLEAVKRVASLNAVRARALGRSDEERSWLDVLGIADGWTIISDVPEQL